MRNLHKSYISWGMVYGMHRNTNMKMNIKMKMKWIWTWNIYAFSSCLNIMWKNEVKWKKESGRWLLKQLTVLKLLVSNNTNATTINNINNYCRQLSCIVGAAVLQIWAYGNEEMWEIYEKYREIYEKYMTKWKETYIYSSSITNTVSQGKTICILKKMHLTNGIQSCHQKVSNACINLFANIIQL